jgi:hypothetical protein
MGLPFGTPGEPLQHYQSRRGHEFRTLAVEDPADYRFFPTETTTQVIERIRSEWCPELLLCWCPERLPPPLAVEACPIRTAAVVSDWTVYYPQIEHNLARYDLVVTDRLGAEVLRPPGVTPHYVGPLYSQRTGVHRPLGVERDLDIVFAGNLNHAAHVQRGRLLEKIAALSGRRRVVIASGLPPEEYTALFNRARIVFNYALRRELNLRSFEALACGAVLFVEADNLEAPAWLRDGETAVFYTPDQLTTQLEFWLQRPADLARIAANAQALSADLAGENRLDAFVEELAALPDQPRIYARYSDEERALAEVLQYASSMAGGQRAHALTYLQRARSRFPGSVALQAAHGCTALERLSLAVPDEAKTLTQTVLEEFRDAAAQRPAAIPLWLNLAFVARHAKARAAEGRFLELALEAQSTEYGGLLVGERRDPYYARWREALAFREARPQMLWAAAAARLAELELAGGDLDSARECAQNSMAWLPGVAAPRITLAQIEDCAGNLDLAISILEEALPLTAFESDPRMALVDLYRRAGRTAQARTLAEESATLFSAWWGAEHAVERFRTALCELA